jgi:tetratricopeptide (TPR) repeat protein
MNMHECHESPRLILRCLAMLTLASCGVAATRTEQVDTAMLAAESALQAGDCRTASEDYVAAALSSSEPKLLQRASEVSLGCGQYALGQKAATRWHAVDPGEAGAELNLVRAQLCRARLADTRRQWLQWLNSKAPPDDGLVAAGIDWLVTTCGSDLTYASLREVHHPLMNGKSALMRMTQLAGQAFNHMQSISYGEAAQKAGAPANSIRVLRLQSLAGLGQADAALQLANEMASTGGEGVLAVAEALMALGRDEEAEAELESRLADPALHTAAEASLAALQLQRGQYAEAERHYTNLMRVQATAAMAVYNLALISERRGDVDNAVRGYELLANSSYDGAARNRIAGLYLRDGEKAQALRLLSAGDDAEPQDLVSAEIAQANLLARSGAVAEGVSRLDTALKNFPDHPDILYQKAVLLEKIDPNAAINLLDSQLRSRPADTGLANALGFTLADHQKDLGRAARLIERALAAQPDSPAILDSQGWLLFRRGDKLGALAQLQRAFNALHDGEIGAHLGEVLWALDRQDEARVAWTRALAADPENADLAAIAARHVPGLSAPKPPASNSAPARGNGPNTTT